MTTNFSAVTAGITLSLLFAAVVPVAGQQRDSTRSEVREDLEEALETFNPEDSETEAEQLTQFLQDLAAGPVNVNRAGIEELRQVPGLNLKTVRAIIEYRSAVKPFEEKRELVRVSGIGRVTLEKIAPYVTVGSGFELGKLLYSDYRYWMSGGKFEAFSRYQRNLQAARGFMETPGNGGYAGSPVKYYQRFRYRSNHLSANLTQEKDAGEPLASPGDFDFNSWHFALKDNGKLQSLVIGDYSLSFGQGLVLWNGGVFGKGSNVTGTPNRNGRGIKPYTSAQETDFHRGVAATYGRRLQVTGFWSYRNKSASVIDADTVRFPGSDGYHRTLTERSRKNSLRQKLYGGRLQAELPVGIIGATGYHTRFSKYVARNSAAYARYNFQGRSHTVGGIDYTLIMDPVLLFGELAVSGNGGTGWIGGLESSIGEDTDLIAVYRSYAKDFQSFSGTGFGESSGAPQNEEGIYLGLRHTLNDRIALSGYFDQYRFSAPRFGTSQPTRGFDWLGRADIRLTAGLQVYLQVRHETKDDEYEVRDPFGRLQRKLDEARRSSLRINLEYRVNGNVRMRTRAETVQNRQAGEKAETGYLLYQDLRLTLTKSLKLDARLSLFDTESFATRVYQFENDLLYVFASRSLYNRGQRAYLLVNYEPSDFLEFWAKFGITTYEDRMFPGSGMNEITGNKRSEIGIQARVRF